MKIEITVRADQFGKGSNVAAVVAIREAMDDHCHEDRDLAFKTFDFVSAAIEKSDLFSNGIVWRHV